MGCPRRFGSGVDDERGFTLVEAMVAVFVLGVSVLAVAHGMQFGLFSSGLARQRAAAEAIANQQLELARALNYDNVELGDAAEIPNADAPSPDRWVNQADQTYDPDGSGPLGYEPLVRLPGAVPSIQHLQSPVQQGNTTYQVYTYVTWVDSPLDGIGAADDPDGDHDPLTDDSNGHDQKRVTVVVTWPSLVQGAVSEISNSSLFSPDSVSFRSPGGPGENQPPIVICPSFSHINLTAYFTANATDIDGTITSYRWDFGDGTVRTNANIYEWHTYATAGEYPVTLTVADDDGQESSTSGCPVTVETTTVPTGSAPTGGITIDDGAVYTTNAQGQVTLKLTAADADGDLAQMQFSVDGSTFGAAEDFDTLTYYTLPGPEGDETVWVRYIDATGNLSVPYSDSITWDRTAPPAPAVLTLSRTKKSVTLQWNAVTASDLGGYRVFRRATSSSVFTAIACQFQGGGTTRCTDSAVVAGTSYEYYVKAYDRAGNESAQSNVAGPV